MNEITGRFMEDLKNGNNKSYESLYKDHFPVVERFILKNSGSADDAKDIFQDTMIVLIEKLHADDFVLTASLKTYITAISKNLWFKKLRCIAYRHEIELSDADSNSFYTDISLSIEKERSYLEKAQFYLASVTDHCKRLLHSMFFKKKTISEIQHEYGYSTRHNAQNQKHKCLEQIRKLKSQ